MARTRWWRERGIEVMSLAVAVNQRQARSGLIWALEAGVCEGGEEGGGGADFYCA